jgi:L-galactose dehydrogenase
VFRASDDDEGIRTVRTALDHGINFIDVSPYYGKTRAETVLGRALKGVARDQYILATKVGQYDDGVFDFSAKRVESSLSESCARLGVSHIDLLQCHDIEFADLGQIVNETLPALVRLREQGRIGHIGITGLPLRVFPGVIGRTAPGVVETILSFCHFALNDTSLTRVLPLCQERGIGVINASPTGMGLLTPRGVPAWHPAPPSIVGGCRRAVEFCQSKGVDIVKLAVQFSISNSQVATTLVGTANPENMRKNIAWAEEEPDFELIDQVREILRPVRDHNYTRGRPDNRDEILA